jgi:hypothetical protein
MVRQLVLRRRSCVVALIAATDAAVLAISPEKEAVPADDSPSSHASQNDGTAAPNAGAPPPSPLIQLTSPAKVISPDEAWSPSSD